MVKFNSNKMRQGQVQQGDLDVLWVCKECGLASLYHSDFKEHKLRKGHHKFLEFDLETGKMVATQYAR